MSSKDDIDYDDDDDDDDSEEEDDEGDFIPGADDDDELDDDLVDEEEDIDDSDSPILQGSLYKTESNALVYEELSQSSALSFRLVSETPAPPSWNPSTTPLLEKPITMKGWIKDPSDTLAMEMSIARLDPAHTIDPLELRFLEKQDASQIVAENGAGASKPQARAKVGDDEDDDAKAPATEAIKEASSDGTTKAGDIFVVTGKQIAADKSGYIRNIRGLFRCPKGSERIYLMATMQTNMVAAASSNTAIPLVAAAAAGKRGRGDDEDEDDGDDAVGYQEVIDLHDDAGLSTEELRRRYYGDGTENTTSESKAKKPKPSSPDHDDDDDDAYGF